jgi:uncharacterized repeat protein (TIGR03803 family)
MVQVASLFNQLLQHFPRTEFAALVGVVFKLDTTGHETELHSFTNGLDGGFPYAGVIRDMAGKLYGTTVVGGASSGGVVFELEP